MSESSQGDLIASLPLMSRLATEGAGTGRRRLSPYRIRVGSKADSSKLNLSGTTFVWVGIFYNSSSPTYSISLTKEDIRHRRKNKGRLSCFLEGEFFPTLNLPIEQIRLRVNRTVVEENCLSDNTFPDTGSVSKQPNKQEKYPGCNEIGGLIVARTRNRHVCKE
ncbi:hypothetical protein NPIL_578071 [Nephila pilipes]|uniref:Uncharacterized protein n=1 Tax=Nephila pilipes TaxID=299642 RepID=A0A8X6P6G1_NEPPI|nr:hypothetical protein NPIL_578071 [Nephila pilipes]